MKTGKRLNLVLLCVCCFLVSVQLYGRQKFSVRARGVGYRVSHTDNSLLLEFSNPLDLDTLSGKIVLRDQTGSLAGNYTVDIYPGDTGNKTAWLKFNAGFYLKESSKYYIDILKGLRYVRRVTRNGKKSYRKLARTKTFHFVTTSQSPFTAVEDSNRIIERTKLIIVSDIHIGGPRATAGNYNWFADNISEFLSFLKQVEKSRQVKELIIAGDLFDEWIMPMDVKPFVGDVTTSAEFFKSVADASPMKDIIKKINNIANGGKIKVVYIPGNHDMLMTEAGMKTIFPNVIWQGTLVADGTFVNDVISGTGYYSPAPGIRIEHGHIYDFFNAPDVLSKPGSLLPPGYFVSRMFATNMINEPQEPQALVSTPGNIFFFTAWELVVWKIFGTFLPDVPAIITDIDGYTASYTYSQARDHYYDADIAGNWEDRQDINGVYSPQSEIAALLAGTGVFIWGDLELSAWKQYFVPGRANIVIFGHTHMAMVKSYNKSNRAIVSEPESLPSEDQLGLTAKIYANSGTWINKKLVSQGYFTRTYIVINIANTDSALPTVSLYQYNSDIDNDENDESVLLNEKNIHPDRDLKKKSLPLIR
jgi:calcineurin-like phosphoesterase family protein